MPAPLISTAYSAESPLGAATLWIEQLLGGSLATAIAISAVAILGFTLLAGRLAFARAGRTVVGMALLFGAAGIARALVDAVDGADTAPATTVGYPDQHQPPAYSPASDDPFAGASLVR